MKGRILWEDEKVIKIVHHFVNSKREIEKTGNFKVHFNK